MTMALERILGLGEAYVDPLTVAVWEQADRTKPWLPRHLLSVPGLPADKALKLSRIDFLRMAFASVWLKTMLVGKLAESGSLRSEGRNDFLGQSRIALRQAREEAGNALMFLRMVDIADLGDVPLLGDTAALDRWAKRLRPDSAELWIAAYVGKSVLDAFAMKVLREDDGICPLSRQILQIHHRDEARQAAAARTLVGERLKDLGATRRMMLGMMMPSLLRRFLYAALFPSAESLAALGIPDPQATARAVRNDAGRRTLAAGCAASAITTLRRAGLSIRDDRDYPW